MPSPLETVQEWFAAHERGDLAAARLLAADDLVVDVSGRLEICGEFRGFGAFMRWYGDRHQVLGSTTDRVEDLLASAYSAAAVLTIADDTTEWHQAAIYAVTDGCIRHIRVFEDSGRRG